MKRIALMVVALAGCGWINRISDGHEGGECYGNSTCNMGLTCIDITASNAAFNISRCVKREGVRIDRVLLPVQP